MSFLRKPRDGIDRFNSFNRLLTIYSSLKQELFETIVKILNSMILL